MRKAVIDVGSNSVLLTVEEQTEAGWIPVREATQVTALGEGVKQTGLLGEPGMKGSLDALKRFAGLAHDADCVAYGTMALRLARNTPEFQNRAAAQGTPVTVLFGDDEAQLGFEAVAYDPEFREWDRVSIIDPGGQSTELTTAHR
jgi:exopolyphosphatase/guanosine-5'-triphosphate,3'-diphosphate pyrophosphatase